MENLKILKSEKRKLLKEIKVLENKLKEKKDRLYVVETKMLEREGLLDEIEDLEENAKNFVKNTKNRPRPSYKRSLDFNEEYEDRINKRQKRKIISPEIIQDEDINQEISINQEGIEGINKEIEQELDVNREELIISTRKIKSKKEIEDLLEELFEEQLVEELVIDREKEILKELSQLYFRVCEQEKVESIERRKTIEIYYDLGKRFEERKNELLKETYNEEKIVISKVIDEIKEGEISHSRNSIKKRSEKARKIYLILSIVGGKEKIRKLKDLNSEEYRKFSFKEIEEWVRNR